MAPEQGNPDFVLGGNRQKHAAAWRVLQRAGIATFLTAKKKIFEVPSIANVGLRVEFLALPADAPRLGVAPYLANAENADQETPAAVAATHGIAQRQEHKRVRGLETGRAQISGSATMAMETHRALFLLS
jgi:hypothetical protein